MSYYSSSPSIDYNNHISSCEKSNLEQRIDKQMAIDKEYERLTKDPAIIIEGFAEQADNWHLLVLGMGNPEAIQFAISKYIYKIAEKRVNGEL